MRTPLAALAIAAAALGPAAAASAKEIASVEVCGADGCTDVTDRATPAITDGGPPTAWPDEATPFYRVKIAVTGEDGETVPGWSFKWVPAAQKVEFEDGTWGNPPSTAIDELEALTRKLAPLPAAKLVLPGGPEPDPAAAPGEAPASDGSSGARDSGLPASDRSSGAREGGLPASAGSGAPGGAGDGGLPAVVWALLAAGGVGFAALLGRAAAIVLGRRGGPARTG